jgi:hypothetical protein
MEKKLTPAQAQALQAKADRRAAAAERRQADIAGDNARIKDLYKETEMTKTNPDVIVALADCPAEVQELVAKIAPLFKEATGVSFPETVIYGTSDRGTEPSYWVNGNALPPGTPALVRRDGKPCNVRRDAQAGAYRFRTPALTTVYSRLRAGKPVFAG